MLQAPAPNSRFEILTGMLGQFVRLNLVVAVLILFLRAGQWISLSMLHSLPADVWLLAWHGFLQDITLWLILSWLLLLPFLLLSLLKKWIGITFFALVFLIAALMEWGLFQYFTIVLTPLDQVVFSYTMREMMTITLSSVEVNLLTFLPFILIILLTVFLIRITRNMRIPRVVIMLFFLIALSAPFLRKTVSPDEDECRNRFEYYLATNKLAYLVEKVNQYLSLSAQQAKDVTIEAAARRYQAAHPEFQFTGTRYPFLHADRAPDVLSPFFNLGKEKPNLVFIIVESLSSCFIGNNPIYGSFTPFLDSLAGHSLFWNNFLSTSDRTFNVLPAIFGSLPPGDPTFVNQVTKIPYHFSLIRYLRENGYHTSFFYAGDPAFNYMEDFLKRQETDYILRSFGPRYQKVKALNDGYHWGHADADLYSRSFEVMDSLPASPRLDIYLTLSLHSPFIPPNQEYYMAQMDNRLKAIDPAMPTRADIERYKNIFATVLYTDDALKGLIEGWKKRPGYQNTIFIVTGDHGLPELNLHRFSGLAHYSVPLFIFSPMLKRSAQLRSVSSHLDITPSLLAMMRANHNIKTRSIAPWMGTGIDTAAAPRNMHTLPFILNNKEINEYVDKSFYLDKNKLYNILPELWIKDTACQAIQQRMIRELADFKTLNTYVTKQNRLVPREIYFRTFLDSLVVAEIDTITFNQADSTSEYRSFFNKLTFDSKFKYLKLEITLDLITQETDTRKAPVIVFDLYSSKGSHLLWYSFDFPCHEGQIAVPGQRKSIYIREYVELSYLQSLDDFSLMMYIWNKAHCIVRFDKPKIKITGYYHKDLYPDKTHK